LTNLRLLLTARLQHLALSLSSGISGQQELSALHLRRVITTLSNGWPQIGFSTPELGKCSEGGAFGDQKSAFSLFLAQPRLGQYSADIIISTQTSIALHGAGLLFGTAM
jgi:hypothetical protein